MLSGTMIRERFQSEGIRIPEDASSARWIEPELQAGLGTVGSIVPARYPAYARIFHPAYSPAGVPMRWGSVARTTGRRMHSLAQWHALIGASDPDDLSDSNWSGGHPDRGALPQQVWKALSRILAREMHPSDECLCALWTGWGALSVWLAQLAAGSPEAAEEWGLPWLSLPPFAGRDYLLLSSKLRNVERVKEIGPVERLPSIIWPERRSWFLVTDIDFDSTLVGGDEVLIREIVCGNEIEAWQVNSEDSLAFDGDVINSD